eukprot:COSAG04_NODE_281_length_18193_cov_4.163701_5_plen_138_part_00
MLPSLMDPTLCARVRDRLWECNGSSRLRRDDPQTWLGPFSPDDTSNETADVRSDYRWKVRAFHGERSAARRPAGGSRSSCWVRAAPSTRRGATPSACSRARTCAASTAPYPRARRPPAYPSATSPVHTGTAVSRTTA